MRREPLVRDVDKTLEKVFEKEHKRFRREGFPLNDSL